METEMGTTDLGTVQLSKTRVKPTSRQWDSQQEHSTVKARQNLPALSPLENNLSMQIKHQYHFLHTAIVIAVVTAYKLWVDEKIGICSTWQVFYLNTNQHN